MALKAYQLRIELQQIKPLIWRRLRMPGSVTLAKVHKIFQIVMGRTDTHTRSSALGHADLPGNVGPETLKTGTAPLLCLSKSWG
jgi:hypothetical protein